MRRSQVAFLVLALGLCPASHPADDVLQQGRIILRAPKGFSSDDEGALVQTLASATGIVEAFLGTQDGRVTVRIYASTGDFAAANKMPWWVGGVLVGDEIQIQPVRVLKRKQILASTLTHEYAHLVLKKVSGEHGPKWLQEGTALYLAKEFPGGPKRKRSWEALERRMGQPLKDRASAFEAYREARSIVEYLLRTYDREKYLNLLENLRIGNDMEEAMKKAFGKGSREVEADFLKSP